MDETRRRLGKPNTPPTRSSANAPLAWKPQALRHSGTQTPGTRHRVASPCHASPPPMSQVRVASCCQWQCRQLQTCFLPCAFFWEARSRVCLCFSTPPPTNQIVQQTTTPSFFLSSPPRALDRALPPCESKSIFLGRVRPLPSLAGASPSPPSSCPPHRFEFSRLRLINFWRAPEDTPPAPRGTLFPPQKAHHGLRRRVCL